MNNREIKFRQPIFNRDGTFKDFLYWGIGLVVDGANMNCGFGTYVKGITDPKDSQQFTGLKDKNNKDIYEGDILQHEFDIMLFKWLITFFDSAFILQNIGVDGYLMDGFRVTQADVRNRIVIGNIYENPELIKP